MRRTVGSRDYLCRVVLLGDQRVGKSSFVARLFRQDFDDNYLSTLGVDYRAKQFSFSRKSSRVHIFDSSGHPDLKNISKSLYQFAEGFVFMYAIDDRASFQSIKEWVRIVNSQRKSGSSAILLGNKQDQQGRQVTEMQARRFAEEQGMNFCETSAKEDYNVSESLTVLVEDILQSQMVPKARFRPLRRHFYPPLLLYVLMIFLSLVL